MYVYRYVCMCIIICTYMYVWVYRQTHARADTDAYTHYIWIYIHTREREIYIYNNVCRYTYISTHVCIVTAEESGRLWRHGPPECSGQGARNFCAFAVDGHSSHAADLPSNPCTGCTRAWCLFRIMSSSGNDTHVFLVI